MIYLIILAGILAALIFVIKTRGKGKLAPRVSDSTPDNISTSNQIQTTTIEGVNLVSGKPVDYETQEVIDKSLTELFADARAIGYTEKLNHADYTIEIKEDCQPRPDGTMAWLVRADNYNNSDFDQNPDPNIGEVYCAEQVMFKQTADFNRMPTMEYAICRGNLELMANTTRYGAEHIILYFNHMTKYQETETHLNGASHPLIPTRTK